MHLMQQQLGFFSLNLFLIMESVKGEESDKHKSCEALQLEFCCQIISGMHVQPNTMVDVYFYVSLLCEKISSQFDAKFSCCAALETLINNHQPCHDDTKKHFMLLLTSSLLSSFRKLINYALYIVPPFKARTKSRQIIHRH
jgi:hypothetical protein